MIFEHNRFVDISEDMQILLSIGIFGVFEAIF